MNSTKTKRWIAALLVAMLTVLGLGQMMVYADEVEEPLTDVIITKVETKAEGISAQDMSLEDLAGGLANGAFNERFGEGSKGLPGITFTYYSVTADQLADLKDGTINVSNLTALGTTAETNVNGEVTIPNLPEGNYWIVEDTKGTIASSTAVPFGLTLPFTNLTGDGFLRAIHVYPKNTLEDVPGGDDIEKDVEEDNVAIGDINEWKVKINIPEGIEDYDEFTFYDRIDSRLDYIDGTVEVSAGGITFATGDYTLEYSESATEGNFLRVVFTEAGRARLAGATGQIVIMFDTKVNDTAIMGEEIPNVAHLEFDNGNGVVGDVTPTETPSVHTGGKAFIKQNESQGTLAGAEFKIKNAAGNFVKVSPGAVTFVGENDATVFTSAANGKFEVKGLPYGDYTLVEIKAPNGYALPTNPEINFDIDANSYEAANVLSISNRKLVIPQTGGMGTILFTVIGSVMMLFSVVFYRRTNKA